MLSPEQYYCRIEAASQRVNPTAAKLHAEIIERWANVYEALAK